LVVSRKLATSVTVLAGAAWIIPGVAHAHLIQSGAGGMGSGFEHPLTGPDHFLAMFAVGLWGAQMGGRSIWTLPVTFPLIMVVGGMLGILGVPLPGEEIGIALSIIALGSAIALRWHPAEWIALLLISVFAICHGHAHGAELPTAADPADYAVGFVIATGFIHLFGIGVGLVLQRPVRSAQSSLWRECISLCLRKDPA
jgi:urease accessory protein